MTNRDKFEEVFGYRPDDDAECLVPIEICLSRKYNCNPQKEKNEELCPFYGWWDKEYKPCFKLRSDL